MTDEQRSLAEEHIAYAKAGARAQYRRSHMFGADADDLEGAAMLGLVLAATTYRDGFGTTFKSYAFTCIQRQMWDVLNGEMRARGWMWQRDGDKMRLRNVRPRTPWPEQADGSPIDIGPAFTERFDETIDAMRQMDCAFNSVFGRERVVLEKLAQGHTQAEIAAEMGLNFRVVSRLYQNAAKAARMAISETCG